jgi:Kazal-type serine protease inhibitor-like protein
MKLPPVSAKFYPHPGEKTMQLVFACVLAGAFAANANSSDQLIFAQVSAPEVCTEIFQPVCGTDANGRRVTYSNACFARVAKATNVTPGECPK